LKPQREFDIALDLSHALTLARDLDTDIDIDPAHIHTLNLALVLARLLIYEIRTHFVSSQGFTELLNSGFLEEYGLLSKNQSQEDENDEQPQ
jgi:hypothetical protein